MALRHDPPRELRPLDDLLADQEEGRVGAVLGQDLEDPRRALRVWAVVERDRHRCWLACQGARLSQL